MPSHAAAPLAGRAPAGTPKCAPWRFPRLTGAGVPALLAAIDEVLPLDPLVRTRLDLSAGDGATLAMIHEFGRVLSTRYDGDRVVVEAEVPESLERRLIGR